jgi:hypothetical protein
MSEIAGASRREKLKLFWMVWSLVAPLAVQIREYEVPIHAAGRPAVTAAQPYLTQPYLRSNGLERSISAGLT